MARPWMPIWIGDYIADTGHLSTLQHGAYFLLMMHYWKAGGLPDDDRQLAQITRLSVEEWRRNKGILRAFFGSDWKHKRLDLELKRHLDIYNKRLMAGQKGDAVRAMKRYRK